MRNLLASLAVSTVMIAGAGHAGTLVKVGGDGTLSSGASLDVFESFNNGYGIYDVTNNTGGDLMGFGVSNNNSVPGLITNTGFGSSGTAFADNDNTSGFTYWARALDASNWETEDINPFGSLGATTTFFDIFGDFATVAGGENTINWYDSVDGALLDGDTVSGFFAFDAFTVASSIIGVTGTDDGTVYFTAGQATTTTTPVPLPAAGWMLIAGIGGLGLIRRRKKA